MIALSEGVIFMIGVVGCATGLAACAFGVGYLTGVRKYEQRPITPAKRGFR